MGVQFIMVTFTIVIITAKESLIIKIKDKDMKDNSFMERRKEKEFNKPNKYIMKANGKRTCIMARGLLQKKNKALL